ncbi:MAG: S8 family serine peptidase [Bacteroidia bacterium]|nr:S8 family serine peptidase [Bacteroidia bacterium]
MTVLLHAGVYAQVIRVDTGPSDSSEQFSRNRVLLRLKVDYHKSRSSREREIHEHSDELRTYLSKQGKLFELTPMLTRISEKEERFEGYFLLKLEQPDNSNVLIENLSSLEYVDWAAFDGIAHTSTSPPNDALRGSQDTYLTAIDAFDAWSNQLGSSDVVVAIIDNGVQYTHPDLSANVYINSGEIDGNGIDDDGNGYDDDYHGYDVADDDGDAKPPATANSTYYRHGTHVAGIVGASTNNGPGISGIGYNVSYLPIKATEDLTLDPTGLYLSDVFKAIEYAIVMKVDVINMSFGSYYTTGFPVALYGELVDYASSNNIVVVAAAGNLNTSNESWPAAFGEVIQVGATTPDGTAKASFSDYRITLDVWAPGVSMLSTVPGGAYVSMDGTSMAAPVVSGLAALLKSKNRFLTVEEIKSCIYSTAVPLTTYAPAGLHQIGHGLIQMEAALNCVPAPVFAGDFSSNFQTVCTDQVIQFQFLQTGGNEDPTSWTWTVTGNGVSQIYTTEHPSMSFSTTGKYTIKLEVSDGTNTLTIEKDEYIKVVNPADYVIFSGLEDNHWVSGNKFHVEFDQHHRVVNEYDDNTFGKGQKFEPSATISNQDGNLLFYTREHHQDWDPGYNNIEMVRLKINNRHHREMQNSHDLKGSYTATNGALIVPIPNTCNERYILFHINNRKDLPAYNPDPIDLYYSIIDMSLDDGLGGIDPAFKNVLLLEDVTERLDATFACDGSIWVATHKFRSDQFVVYPVNNNPNNPLVPSGTRAYIGQPVTTSIGSIHGDAPSYSSYQRIGELDFSPDGSKIAVALHESSHVEVFDFDNTTGTLSNYIDLGPHVNTVVTPPPSNAYSAYGLAFSPNNQYLYVSNPTFVFQHDLASATPANATKLTGGERPYWQMELSPFGTVVVAGGINGNRYNEIQQPDNPAATSSLVGVSGAGLGRADVGLPNNFISSSFLSNLSNATYLYEKCPEVETVNLQASYLGANDYRWSTGETTGSIIISEYDEYTVTYTDVNNCVQIETYIVKERITDLLVDLGPNVEPEDCVFPITLEPTIITGYAPSTLQFLWSTGETTETIDLDEVDFPGKTIRLTVTAPNGCKVESKVYVSTINCCYLSQDGTYELSLDPTVEEEFVCLRKYSDASFTGTITLNKVSTGGFNLTWITEQGAVTKVKEFTHVDDQVINPSDFIVDRDDNSLVVIGNVEYDYGTIIGNQQYSSIVLKYDAENDQIVWKKGYVAEDFEFGSPGGRTFYTSVSIDQSKDESGGYDGYVIGGAINIAKWRNLADHGQGIDAANWDALVYKIDPVGNLLWHRVLSPKAHPKAETDESYSTVVELIYFEEVISPQQVYPGGYLVFVEQTIHNLGSPTSAIFKGFAFKLDLDGALPAAMFDLDEDVITSVEQLFDANGVPEGFLFAGTSTAGDYMVPSGLFVGTTGTTVYKTDMDLVPTRTLKFPSSYGIGIRTIPNGNYKLLSALPYQNDQVVYSMIELNNNLDEVFSYNYEKGISGTIRPFFVDGIEVVQSVYNGLETNGNDVYICHQKDDGSYAIRTNLTSNTRCESVVDYCLEGTTVNAFPQIGFTVPSYDFYSESTQIGMATVGKPAQKCCDKLEQTSDEMSASCDMTPDYSFDNCGLVYSFTADVINVNGINYKWTIDGDEFTGRSVNYEFTENGSYTVCLEVTYPLFCETCTLTNCETIVVDVEEETLDYTTCDPGVWFNPCDLYPELDHYEVSSSTHAGYDYDSEDGYYDNGTHIFGCIHHNLLVGGTFTFELYDEDDCLYKIVTVNVHPGVATLHTMDYVLCPLDCILFDPASVVHCQPATGPVLFTFGSTITDLSLAPQLVCHPLSGPYQIDVTLPNGCPCTVTGNITSLENCEGVAEPDDLSNTNEGVLNQEVLIFPNPASESFEVQLQSEEYVRSIRIFDNTGKLVDSHEVMSSVQRVPLTLKNMAEGLYQVEVILNDRQVRKTLLISK